MYIRENIVNMNNYYVISRQLIVMFMFMTLGYLMYRNKMIDNCGAKSIGNLLIYVVLPCSILSSFINNNENISYKLLVYSIILSLIALIISIFVSSLLFKSNPIDNFGVSFSNAGFMGIPIIVSILGSKYVIYASSYIALLNILQFFYGQRLLSGKTVSKNKLTILKNPLVISFSMGIIIYLINLPVPNIILEFAYSVANINSPLAMVLLGTYLAQIRGLNSFRNINLLVSSITRLIIIPLLTILVFWILNIKYEIILPIVICVSAPVGSNLAVYAQKLDKDYVYSVELISISTLLSLITMPLVLQFANLII